MWKILDVVKCQTWRHFRCGEILDVCKFVWFHELLALACQANRWYKSHRFAVRYLLMKFTVICRIFCFIVIYAVLSQNFFCRNLRSFCVEKNYTQNFVRGEKMTNIMYEHLYMWQSGMASSCLLCKYQNLNYRPCWNPTPCYRPTANLSISIYAK